MELKGFRPLTCFDVEMRGKYIIGTQKGSKDLNYLKFWYLDNGFRTYGQLYELKKKIIINVISVSHVSALSASHVFCHLVVIAS